MDIEPQYRNIPIKFRGFTDKKMWVCCGVDGDDKHKYAKAPVKPGTNNLLLWKKEPETISTWEEVCENVSKFSQHKFRGIILNGGELACVDFDHCLDPITHEFLDFELSKRVALLMSWTEISGSGTGVHVWIRTPPNQPNIKPTNSGYEFITTGHVRLTGVQFENYDSIRFIEQEELDMILPEVYGKPMLLGKKKDPLSIPIVKAEPYKAPNSIIPGSRHENFKKLVASCVAKNLAFPGILALCLEENKAVNNPPLPDDEVRKKIASLYGWCLEKERQKQKKPAAEKSTPTAEPETYSEIAVSEWFVHSLNGEYLFNASSKLWHHWTGKVWEIDRRDTIKTRYKEFAKGLYSDLSDIQDGEKRKNAFKSIQYFNAANGMSHVIGLSGHALLRLVEDFDKDPHLLNVQNGTIVFGDTSFTLKPHDKADMISRICNVSYEPTAAVPQVWVDHISTIACGDAGLIANMQFMFGYILDGGNPLERFMMWVGAGRNGKSITQRTYSTILGDYSTEVNALTLMETGNKSNSPERKIMRGARFIVAQESRKSGEKESDRCMIDAGFVKTASGRDGITVRDNHGNVMDNFKIPGQICLSTNNLPKVDDQTTSFWDRIIVIPFNKYFEESERISDMEVRLLAVSPGILNWCLDGWLQFKQAKTFTPCNSVMDQINEYRADCDEYALFVRDCIERKANGSVGARELFTYYGEWCKKRGIESFKSETQFSKDFKGRYPKGRTEKGVAYKGIVLKEYF